MASLHYPEATREWERLPPTSKTWTAWHLKYREANVERMRLLKANPTSFGAANNVSGSDMKAETAAIEAALNSIANAATSDSALMTQIMAQLKAITTPHGRVTTRTNTTCTKESSQILQVCPTRLHSS